MSALAANTANVVILEDNHNRSVFKMWGFTSAGDAEASVLKVNAAALVGACMDLTINAAQLATATKQYKFVPGEVITANGGSGAVGVVATWTPGAGAANSFLRVVLTNATVPFANTDAIVGGRLGTAVTIINAARPWYQLNIESIWHTITGKNGEAVGLEWQDASGGANTITAVLLHGENYLGKSSTIPTRIPNPHANTDPNLFLSTYNFAAKSSYTLLVEIGKADGYGVPVAG